MSPEDLTALKKRDSFLYYSIPGAARSARLLLDENDIDTTNLGASRLMRRCTSLPSSLWKMREEQAQAQTTVRRRSVISYECHPDILLFDDAGWEDDDNDSIDLSP